MPIIAAPPPVIIATLDQHAPPPLAFLGFQVGMPIPKAEALVKSSGGKLSCKPATTKDNLDCTGTLPYPGFQTQLELRIGSVKDAAALIVVTARMPERTGPNWASGLREDYGPPKHIAQPGVQQSWEWSRGHEMLRIVERKASPDKLETSVMLGTAPLPDLPAPQALPHPD